MCLASENECSLFEVARVEEERPEYGTNAILGEFYPALGGEIGNMLPDSGPSYIEY